MPMTLKLQRPGSQGYGPFQLVSTRIGGQYYKVSSSFPQITCQCNMMLMKSFFIFRTSQNNSNIHFKEYIHYLREFFFLIAIMIGYLP